MADHLEVGLVAWLKSQSPDVAGGRIYPKTLPQNWTSPAIRFERLSGDRLRGLDGPHGRDRPRIRFQVFSRGDYLVGHNVARELKDLIDGFAGTMGTVTVDAASLVFDADGPYEAAADIYQYILDFLISYRE